MIVKMEKLVLHALSEDKKQILDRLMELGCVQLLPPEQMEEYETLAPVASRDVPGTWELESKLSEIASALSVLSEHEPKAGLFQKRAQMDFDRLLTMDSIDEALKRAASVRGIVQNIAEVKSFVSADQFQRQTLEPWAGFDMALDALESRFCEVLLFTVPLETGLEELRGELAPCGCWAEQVSADNDLRYIAAAVLKSAREEAVRILRERGGLPVPLAGLRGTVGANIAAIDARGGQYQENLKVLGENLAGQAQDTSLLKAAYDQLSAAIGGQRSRQNLLLTQETFVAAGWVPVPDKARVEKALAGFCCFYEYRAPENPEDVPVKFKNNKLITPFESITEMYGFPSPTSVDPNPLLAPFFFVFFGMMLSDAGYGILLIVLGLFISKMVKKDGMLYKLSRMIAVCGVSTVIWGAIYGGWFGNVISQFALAFFGKEITIPLLIDPFAQPMTILILSIAFGVVHIFVGMGVRAWLLIRRGRLLDAIFDIGFWYLVLGGLIVLLLGSVSGAGILTNIGMGAAVAGAVGLLLTGGRDKPSILGKITGGLGSLYDITSYFSDILSYSRILALGLATSVIAMVVNILATMAGRGIVGLIVFIVIFVFGHALNLAINALGSYVHTSRLQYVEFFGKFYEGGGKPFSPLRAETKYHILSAKEEH